MKTSFAYVFVTYSNFVIVEKISHYFFIVYILLFLLEVLNFVIMVFLERSWYMGDFINIIIHANISSIMELYNTIILILLSIIIK